MKHPIALITSVTILVLFVISLIPWTAVQPPGTGNLRAAIAEVQNLQKSAASSTADLRLDFVDTVSALRAAAGINTLVTGKTDEADSKSQKITVCVRIPYLLSNSSIVHIIGGEHELALFVYHADYQSHIRTPDTPPPTFS